MARYLIIRNADQLVVNAVLWDGLPPWSVPVGFEARLTDAGDIGWTHLGGDVYAPPPPPPDPRPWRTALLASIAAIQADATPGIPGIQARAAAFLAAVKLFTEAT